MKDPTEEIRPEACIVGWTHEMKDERLRKRTETKKHGGCRKRGRLGWEDCLSDPRWAEEEEWREKASNRE